MTTKRMPLLFPIKNSLLLCLLTFCGLGLFAQNFNQRHNTTDYMYQGNSRDVEERPIIFYFFPYHGELLDLRPYKNLVSANDMPDQMAVKLPFLGNFIDTTIGVAHLEYIEAGDTSLLPVICIVGDFNSSNPTFFFDHNLDKDYSNEASTIFAPRKKYYSIVLKGTDGVKHGFTLENFKINEAQEAVDGVVSANKTALKLPPLPDRTNQFSAGLGLNIGFGQIKYAYSIDSSGLNVDYLRNFSATGFAATMQYNWNQLAVVARLSYDNVFYWTSTQTVQVTQDQILEKINRDILPPSRFSAEFGLGYDFKVASDIVMKPYVAYAVYGFNKDNSYQPERTDRDKYVFDKRNFMVFGFQPKVLLNSRSSAFIDFAYKTGDFSAEGFFEGQGAATPKTNSLREVRVAIGMEYRFL